MWIHASKTGSTRSHLNVSEAADVHMCLNNNNPFDAHGWRIGKVYFLVKWQIPEGFSKKTSMLDATFLVNGQERPVDINFFRYLERIE